jgi:hypothetical protein
VFPSIQPARRVESRFSPFLFGFPDKKWRLSQTLDPTNLSQNEIHVKFWAFVCQKVEKTIGIQYNLETTIGAYLRGVSMSQKTKRIVIIAVMALAGLLFFQNLTPFELDETLNTAIAEKAQTEEVVQKQTRGPASLGTPVPVQGSLEAPSPEENNQQTQ